MRILLERFKIAKTALYETLLKLMLGQNLGSNENKTAFLFNFLLTLV
jgi:hypothetical protein